MFNIINLSILNISRSKKYWIGEYQIDFYFFSINFEFVWAYKSIENTTSCRWDGWALPFEVEEDL